MALQHLDVPARDQLQQTRFLRSLGTNKTEGLGGQTPPPQCNSQTRSPTGIDPVLTTKRMLVAEPGTETKFSQFTDKSFEQKDE